MTFYVNTHTLDSDSIEFLVRYMIWYDMIRVVKLIKVNVKGFFIHEFENSYIQKDKWTKKKECILAWDSCIIFVSSDVFELKFTMNFIHSVHRIRIELLIKRTSTYTNASEFKDKILEVWQVHFSHHFHFGTW